MFLIAKGTVFAEGTDLKMGDIVAFDDLSPEYQQSYNKRAFDEAEADVASALLAQDGYRFVRLGKTMLEGPAVAEQFDGSVLESILDNNISNAAVEIAKIDDIEALEELRELEVNGDGRKGIFNAIDDQIAKLDADPTPMEEPPHVIAETAPLGIEEVTE